MPRSITIAAPMGGRSLDATLQYALGILSWNHVLVDSAAQNTLSDGRRTATILVSYLDDRQRALQLLATAGIYIGT
jgi:hypothetical protein